MNDDLDPLDPRNVFDLAAELGATDRTVTVGSHDGEPVRTVVASRTYAADVADLWDALTSADRIPRWFLPVSGDLRIGGRFQLEGNAGGEITTCDPPHHLAVTWEFGGDTSWVDVSLTEASGGTRLVLSHTVGVGPHWDEFGPGAVGIGWELSLWALGRHLPSGAALDPAEVEAWQRTDAAKAFIRGTAEGWGAADIASGTPSDVARAVAERTAHAYTDEG